VLDPSISLRFFLVGLVDESFVVWYRVFEVVGLIFFAHVFFFAACNNFYISYCLWAHAWPEHAYVTCT
jgi:hypothetical protein